MEHDCIRKDEWWITGRKRIQSRFHLERQGNFTLFDGIFTLFQSMLSWIVASSKSLCCGIDFSYRRHAAVLFSHWIDCNWCLMKHGFSYRGCLVQQQSLQPQLFSTSHKTQRDDQSRRTSASTIGMKSACPTMWFAQISQWSPLGFIWAIKVPNSSLKKLLNPAIERSFIFVCASVSLQEWCVQNRREIWRWNSNQTI